MLETDSNQYHCKICNKTYFTEKRYNQHCSGKHHEAKVLKINKEHKEHFLNNFYNYTDYKKIRRYVYSVCSRFRMTNDVKMYELEIEKIKKIS